MDKPKINTGNRGFRVVLIADFMLRFRMMKLLRPVYFFILIATADSGFAQRLIPFTSILNRAENNGRPEPVPYGRTTGFFDCLEPGIQADTMMDGKKWLFIYIQIPAEVQEIGIRFISPVPQNHFPNTGDIVSGRYFPEKGKSAWFNPYMILEQWVAAESDSSVSIIPGWRVLDTNDDSDDAPSQPDGKNHNSVIRVIRGPYPAGTYRVRFGAADTGQPRGCFLLQTGTIPAMKGIIIREQR